MSNSEDDPLEMMIARSYETAYAYHGDFGLEPETYLNHFYSIIEKHLGADRISSVTCEFVNKLHSDDLYLAVACVQGSEAAWSRFMLKYGPYIHSVSRHMCTSTHAAKDLADSIPGHVFMPDSNGRSRMASYEGFRPLTTWLAAIIKHKALNEHRLKFNNLESLDRVLEQTYESSIDKIELSITASRYEPGVRDSIRQAFSLLSDRERFILRLRYEQELKISQIARMLNVKSPAVSRQLDRIREKLRKHVVAALETRHNLGPVVIQECLAGIAENPEHFILS